MVHRKNVIQIKETKILGNILDNIPFHWEFSLWIHRKVFENSYTGLELKEMKRFKKIWCVYKQKRLYFVKILIRNFCSCHTIKSNIVKGLSWYKFWAYIIAKINSWNLSVIWEKYCCAIQKKDFSNGIGIVNSYYSWTKITLHVFGWKKWFFTKLIWKEWR